MMSQLQDTKLIEIRQVILILLRTLGQLSLCSIYAMVHSPKHRQFGQWPNWGRKKNNIFTSYLSPNSGIKIH